MKENWIWIKLDEPVKIKVLPTLSISYISLNYHLKVFFKILVKLF